MILKTARVCLSFILLKDNLFPQIAHQEPVRETAAVIQLPEEEEEPLPADDQPGETPFEPEQPEVDDAEGPEGERTEPEAPLEDVMGEPTEPGTYIQRLFTCNTVQNPASKNVVFKNLLGLNLPVRPPLSRTWLA